jgi:transposase
MALSIDLRRRIVEAYSGKQSGTYFETAKMFGVGEATVSRLLRLHRETGDVEPKPHRSNNPRRVDLLWLKRHLREKPDATLAQRVEAWVAQGGTKVSLTSMWFAVKACGWSHKKNSDGQRTRPARGEGEA